MKPFKHIELDHLAASLPNLDCFVTPGECGECADELKEVAAAMASLHAYAMFKGKAMKHRLAGEINQALHVESVCDSLYKQLPEWAKW